MNGDIATKAVTLRDGVVDLEQPSLRVPHAVIRQLLLPCICPELSIVVLRVDGKTALLSSEARNDITPALVIVNTNSDDDVLGPFVGSEAESARGTAVTHFEDVLAVDLRPSSIVPDGLLDDTEEGVGVLLMDANRNRVRHDCLVKVCKVSTRVIK